MDASKAFDRVNHTGLFKKLLKKNLSPVIVHLLLAWYSEQMLGACWNTVHSDVFLTSNGVHQGGVLSPILFTIYIDDLLVELEKVGVGCLWGHLLLVRYVMLMTLLYLPPVSGSLE